MSATTPHHLRTLRPWQSAALALAVLVGISVIGVETPEKQEQDLTSRSQVDDDLYGLEFAPEEEAVAGDEATGGPQGGRRVSRRGPGQGAAGGATGGAAGPDGQAATGPGGGPGAAGPGAGGEGGGPSGPLACEPGRNGGDTDRGVKGNELKLASTNVRSGTGASFLGSSYIAMEAVKNRVNSSGGICGRQMSLQLVDDGWDAARGGNYIANFAKDDYFALPVVPSSEGLTQAINNGTISGAGIPVVGTDGMLKEQYNNEWVWPVATPTVSTMRIMARHAADQGANTFGIVFDQFYKFGKEGAAAFRDYVQKGLKKDLRAYVGLEPGRGSYAAQAQKFNEDCGSDGCDFVAILLTPETAATYIASQSDRNGRRQGFGTMLTGGAQPLFNERFARDCGAHCDGMLVWTGYNPPIGRLKSLPDVAEYIDAVKSVDPGVDETNQFLQGAYLGMKVFVQALEQVGPNVTRDGLKQVMNSMTYESDLSSPLSWSEDKRCANLSAQAFRIVTSSGSFAGFAEAGTQFITDPSPCSFPG